MLIGFEGMDGVGKTTLANYVSNDLNIPHETQKLANILGVDDKKFRTFVKDIRTSDIIKLAFMFYTFRCMYDKSNTRNKDLIVDRTMMSTYFFEHSKLSENDLNYVMSLDCIPDLTFILYATPETRKHRISLRENQEDLKSAEALSDGYSEMLEFAKKYNIPYVGIDTEKYNLSEIIDICESTIDAFKNASIEEREQIIKDCNKIYGFDHYYDGPRLEK